MHQDLQTVLRCHIAALEAIGGAPREILYDRMKTAVIGEDADGLVIYNRCPSRPGAALRLPASRLPAVSGQDQGQGRAAVPLHSRGLLPGRHRSATSTTSMRSSATGSTRSPIPVCTRPPSASSTKPSPRRSRRLKPLPLAPYRAVLKLERRVSHEGMVSVGGNLYSVPDTTRRRVLDVHVFADEIRIFENGAARRQLIFPSKAATRSVSTLRIARYRHSRRRRRSDGEPSRHPPCRRSGRAPLARLLRRRRSQARERGRAMNAHAEIVPSLVDRIKHTLVGLKMPRAIEILDATVRRLERGEMTALEAIDALLAEEFTLRENRRIKTALVMARLSTIKTLAGFDFSFQPSLDKNRIMALAELKFIDRAEVVHLLGPPGTGKSHLSAWRSASRRSKPDAASTSATLADLVERPRQGRTRGHSAREDPLLLPLRAAHRR